jgi:hypothetical protein
MNIAYAGIFELYDNPSSRVFAAKNIFSSVFTKYNSCNLLLKLYQETKSVHVKTNCALAICLIHSSSAALLSPTVPLTPSSATVAFPAAFRDIISSLLSKEGILNKKTRERVLTALLCVHHPETVSSLLGRISGGGTVIQFKGEYPFFVSISSPPQTVPCHLQTQLPSAASLSKLPGVMLFGESALFTSSTPQTVVVSTRPSAHNPIMRVGFTFGNTADEDSGEKKKKADEEEPDDEDYVVGPRCWVVGLWHVPLKLNGVSSSFLLGSSDAEPSVGFYNTGVVDIGSGNGVIRGMSTFADGDEVVVEFNGSDPANRTAVFFVNGKVQKFVVEKIPDNVHFAV